MIQVQEDLQKIRQRLYSLQLEMCSAPRFEMASALGWNRAVTRLRGNESVSEDYLAVVRDFAIAWGRLMQEWIDAGEDVAGVADETLKDVIPGGISEELLRDVVHFLSFGWKHRNEIAQWYSARF